MAPQISQATTLDDHNDDHDDERGRAGPIEASSSSGEPSYTVSTAALCFCMLTHSYLLISVFPYSGFMAIDLIDEVNEENAGSYAGFIASSFMLGRAASSFGWGKAADTFGRTTILYLSLGLSCLFSILFGLATTFPAALICRFCLGLSNGIMPMIKTTISELAEGNQKLESRGMSIVLGFWGWGFLIAPVISGALAEPMRQYPDAEWLQNNKVLQDVLSRHPFLLPNLLGATMCLIAMATVAMFVRETLPAEKRKSLSYAITVAGRKCRSCLPGYRYRSLPVLKAHESDILQNDDAAVKIESEATMASIWARKKTRTCLSIHWGYSFVSLSVDETFPLFCISRVAGFGLAEAHIGKILSLCGLLFALAQYGVCAIIFNRFGLHGSIRVGASMVGPIILLVPLSLWLNRGAEVGELNLTTFLYLSVSMALFRVFSLVFFSNISVAMNQSVPASERATMNGLCVLGASFSQGLGPAFAGFLVSFSVSWLGKYASIMIFSTIALLAACAMTSAFLFFGDDDEDDEDFQKDNTDEKEAKADNQQAIELINKQHLGRV